MKDAEVVQLVEAWEEWVDAHGEEEAAALRTEDPRAGWAQGGTLSQLRRERRQVSEPPRREADPLELERQRAIDLMGSVEAMQQIEETVREH